MPINSIVVCRGALCRLPGAACADWTSPLRAFPG